jgi:hypothetical protein
VLSPFIDGILEPLIASVIVGFAGFIIFKISSLPRRLIHMVDDWFGEEARPGVPLRPGVMERLYNMETDLSTVKHEVQFNSGHSIKDAVVKTGETVAQLTTTLDAHIALSQKWENEAIARRKEE